MKRAHRKQSQRWLCRVCAVILPGALTQCETPEVVATAGETTTPEHNFAKHEYPFDSSGKYREDWVDPPSGVDAGGSGAGSSSATSREERSFEPKTTNSARSANSAPASRTSPVSTGNSATQVASVSRSTLRFHKIGRGDTLWGLSRRYGVPVSAIKRANGLNSDAIRMGQTLRIP